MMLPKALRLLFRSKGKGTGGKVPTPLKAPASSKPSIDDLFDHMEERRMDKILQAFQTQSEKPTS